MTIKEAILKSLEDFTAPTTTAKITDHIISKKYYSFDAGKTPWSTVSAICGDFIRNRDVRVRRIGNRSTYLYYLAKNESTIEVDDFAENESSKSQPKSKKENSFSERDLHKLLSSYLKNSDIYTKTIFHEQSSNG